MGGEAGAGTVEADRARLGDPRQRRAEHAGKQLELHHGPQVVRRGALAVGPFAVPAGKRALDVLANAPPMLDRESERVLARAETDHRRRAPQRLGLVRRQVAGEAHFLEIEAERRHGQQRRQRGAMIGIFRRLQIRQALGPGAAAERRKDVDHRSAADGSPRRLVA